VLLTNTLVTVLLEAAIMASLYNLVQQAKASIAALLKLGFCWIYLTALSQLNTILLTDYTRPHNLNYGLIDFVFTS